MNKIIYFFSPFDLSRQEKFIVSSGQTVRCALSAHGLLARMSEQAVVVARNGVELVESEWDSVIKESDLITLHQLPQGPVIAWVIANWVMVAYVAATALYLANLDEPSLPDTASLRDASPTYSISSRANAARLGAPKPVFYGRVRTWPDLSAAPFTEFEADGDQILYQLFEVRQGRCEILESDMRIEDTPLTDFKDYSVEVVQPGEVSRLYPGPVVVSNEFSSWDLVADSSTEPGVSTAYTVCDIGQKVMRISVDLVAPGGIFSQDKSGKFKTGSAAYRIEARLIDDNNKPLADWINFQATVSGDDLDYIVGSSPDAIRKTFSYAVNPGRYQVRVTGFRLPDSDAAGEALTWTGLRGFLVDSFPMTTTTRVALRIRSSEQIGNKGLGRFNLISAGKIPVWHPVSGWSQLATTANPAWVFADIARNSVYGGGRSDPYLDLQGLYALAQQLDEEGVRFDGGFDTVTTVWDALTRVAAVARAVPVDRSGVYYMVRDSHAPQPSYMFTHANIVRDSFKINYASVLEETADSVRVRFFDEAADYRQNSFVCALPGSAKQNPREVTLFGCTNQRRAFEWGMYLAAINHYRRITVQFDTGIEGYLPFFYDTVAVSHYLVGRDSAAQVSGEVIDFDGDKTLTLSESIAELDSPFIIIRGLDGSPTEPYPVTALTENRIQIDGPFDKNLLRFDADFERPHFMCGEGEHFYARIKITNISPQAKGIYRIQGFIDAPEVYLAADGLNTPPVNVLPAPVSILPVVENVAAVVRGTQSAPQIYVSWVGRRADYFIVEYSLDNSPWLPVGDGKFYEQSAVHELPQSPTPKRNVSYRVAGVNLSRGEWGSVTVAIEFRGVVEPTRVRLSSVLMRGELTFLWDSAVDRHKILFFKSVSAMVPVYAVDVVGTRFDLTAVAALRQNLGRHFWVAVVAFGLNELSSVPSVRLQVDIPALPLVNDVRVSSRMSTMIIEYQWPAARDLAGVSVWVSAQQNFIPTAANKVIDKTQDRTIVIPIAVDDVRYVRIAAEDLWASAQDPELMMSAEYKVIGADADALLKLLSNQIKESELAKTLTDRINLIDAPEIGLLDITQKILIDAQALAKEAQAIRDAVVTEEWQRRQAVSQEIADRKAALIAEAQLRQAAVTTEEKARQSADESLSGRVSTLTSKLDDATAVLESEQRARAAADSAESTSRELLAAQLIGGYTGTDINALQSGLLHQERMARVTADASMATQMALLTAGANNEFDYAKIWYFDTEVEGWIGNPGLPSVQNPGWLRPADSPTDPYLRSPEGLNVDAVKYTQVRARIRKVGNPRWEGTLLWKRVGEAGPFSGDRALAIAEPSYAEGIALLAWNPPWSGVINGIRLDITSSQSATDYIEIDWVAIGRPSPGASSAELFNEMLVRANADGALSQRIDTLSAGLGGKASSQALDAISVRVDETEKGINSQSEKITSLENNVAQKAESWTVSMLSDRIISNENNLIVQSKNVVSLQNKVNMAINLLPTEQWVVGASGSQGDWIENTGGSGCVNTVVNDILGPFGAPEMMWRGTAGTNAQSASGGFNVTISAAKIPKERGCVFYGFFKHDGAYSGNYAGNFYVGTSFGQVTHLNGVVNGNPYFNAFAVDLINANEWYLYYGVVHPYGSTVGSSSSLTGIYRLATGEKIFDGEEYRAHSNWNDSSQTFRSYLYYSDQAGRNVWWARPTVMPLDVAPTPWEIMRQDKRLPALSSALESLDSEVRNSAAGLAVTSEKLLALEGAVNGTNVAAFNTLKTSITADLTQTVNAVAKRAGFLEASMPHGGNLIPSDTEFLTDAAGWTTWVQYGEVGGFGRDYAGEEWTPLGYHQIGTNHVGENEGVFDLAYPDVRVIGGRRYSFSAFTASHRCDGQMIVAFYDLDGVYLTEYRNVCASSQGGTQLEDWAQSNVFADAPAGASYARLILRAYRHAGYSYPYIWLCRPMFCEVSATQTVTPLWQPSSAAMSARIASEETARASADSALAMRTGYLEADMHYAKALILNEERVRTEADNVFSQNLRVLSASLADKADGQVTAKAIDDVVASVDRQGDEIKAVAGRAGYLEVLAEEAYARITDVENVQVQGDFVNAEAIRQVNSVVGGHSATLQVHTQSLNGLMARWDVKAQVGELVGGIGVVNENGKLRFYAAVDQIAFYPPGLPQNRVIPFIFDGGVVRIDTAYIRDLSTDSLRVGAATVAAHDGRTSALTAMPNGHVYTSSTIDVFTLRSSGAPVTVSMTANVDLYDMVLDVWRVEAVMYLYVDGRLVVGMQIPVRSIQVFYKDTTGTFLSYVTDSLHLCGRFTPLAGNHVYQAWLQFRFYDVNNQEIFCGPSAKIRTSINGMGQENKI